MFLLPYIGVFLVCYVAVMVLMLVVVLELMIGCLVKDRILDHGDI